MHAKQAKQAKTSSEYVLVGPGAFQLRPDINPMNVLLVDNVFNSIIYFSLVRSRQNKVYATRHIYDNNYYYSSSGTVYMHALASKYKCEENDMVRTWIGCTSPCIQRPASSTLLIDYPLLH